jgi:hypothetical protein
VDTKSVQSPQNKLWSLFSRVGNFVFALLIVLLTIEVCARVDDKIRFGAPFWGGYSANVLRSSDSDGLPYNLPYARFEKWRHNGHGFRGPDIMKQKAPGVTRVVCMGTSETYGLYESVDKEWPAQLRSIVPAAKYEIINASVVGLRLNSYESYLKKRVMPLRPDIVVLVTSPLLYVSSADRATHAKVDTKTTKNSAVTPPQRSKLSKIIDNVRSLPKLKQLVKQVMNHNFPETLKTYNVKSMLQGVQQAEKIRLAGRKPIDVVPEIFIDRFKDDMRALIGSLRTLGVDVMLCTSPTLISHQNLPKYPDIFLDSRRFCVELSFFGMIDGVDKINAAIGDVAREQRTGLIDPAAVLPKTTEYFGDNVHLTDKGARLFAEKVAAQLERTYQ